MKWKYSDVSHKSGRCFVWWPVLAFNQDGSRSWVWLEWVWFESEYSTYDTSYIYRTYDKEKP